MKSKDNTGSKTQITYDDKKKSQDKDKVINMETIICGTWRREEEVDSYSPVYQLFSSLKSMMTLVQRRCTPSSRTMCD